MRSSDLLRQLRSIGPRMLAGGLVACAVQVPSGVSVAKADEPGSVQVASAQQLAWNRAVCLAELSWLANPATFHEHLTAVLAGDCLEIHGTISNEATRNLAMKLAREAAHMTVVDHMTTASVPTQPAPRRSLTMIYQDSIQALYHDCPQLSRSLTISTQDRGEVLVRGEVATLEEKLAISRSLKAVAGCNCVKNQVRARTGMSISLTAPGAKPPLQDNSLLARLGLVQPRTEMVSSAPAIVRHQVLPEPATGSLAPSSTALVRNTSTREPASVSNQPQHAAAPTTPKVSTPYAHATVAPEITHAPVVEKPATTAASKVSPVAGSIILTSASTFSETDRLRRSIAVTCGIDESAVAIVAREPKALAITMTLPDVETGKLLAAKVLAMPELVPYGVTLDVSIGR